MRTELRLFHASSSRTITHTLYTGHVLYIVDTVYLHKIAYQLMLRYISNSKLALKSLLNY